MHRYVSIAFICLASTSVSADDSVQPKANAQDRVTLRDVFFGQEDPAPAGAVGRLGIVLVKSGLLERVGIRHPFRSGDKFRFDVTANQDGWLVIVSVPNSDDIIAQQHAGQNLEPLPASSRGAQRPADSRSVGVRLPIRLSPCPLHSLPPQSSSKLLPHLLVHVALHC